MRRSTLVPLPPLLLVSVFSEPAAARGSAPAALGLRRIGGGRSRPARASTSTTKALKPELDAKFEFSTVTHLMRSNKWSELFEFGSRRSRSFLCIPHHESSSARGMRAVCAHQRRERHRQRARTVCARTPKGQINASHIPSDVSLRVQNTTDCAKFKRSFQELFHRFAHAVPYVRQSYERSLAVAPGFRQWDGGRGTAITWT